MWPVGLVGGMKYERPVVEGGKVGIWFCTFTSTVGPAERMYSLAKILGTKMINGFSYALAF